MPWLLNLKYVDRKAKVTANIKHSNLDAQRMLKEGARMLAAPGARRTNLSTSAANRKRKLSGLPKRCWPGRERVKAMQCGFPEEMFRAGK